jgi:putative heme iron utilization protein
MKTMLMQSLFTLESLAIPPIQKRAQMLSIDAQGMNLVAQVKSESIPLRIEFDHILKDSEDAHHTLIDMVKQARTRVK